jgi:hypothetical protein
MCFDVYRQGMERQLLVAIHSLQALSVPPNHPAVLQSLHSLTATLDTWKAQLLTRFDGAWRFQCSLVPQSDHTLSLDRDRLDARLASLDRALAMLRGLVKGAVNPHQAAVLRVLQETRLAFAQQSYAHKPPPMRKRLSSATRARRMMMRRSAGEASPQLMGDDVTSPEPDVELDDPELEEEEEGEEEESSPQNGLSPHPPPPRVDLIAHVAAMKQPRRPITSHQP